MISSESDSERAKRDRGDVDSNAKIEDEVTSTEVELLRKKLMRELELRNVTFSDTKHNDPCYHFSTHPKGEQLIFVKADVQK